MKYTGSFFVPISKIWERILSKYGKKKVYEKIHLLGGSQGRANVSISDTGNEEGCNYSLQLAIGSSIGHTVYNPYMLFRRIRQRGTTEDRLLSIPPFFLQEDEEMKVQKLFINMLRNYERMLAGKIS